MLEYIKQIEDINLMIKIVKLTFIILLTLYTFKKIINEDSIKVKYLIVMITSSLIIAIISIYMEYNLGFYYSSVVLILFITIINKIYFHKDNIYTVLLTIVALGINYIIYGVSIAIAFFICIFMNIKNDYIVLCVILGLYLILFYRIFKIKKIQYGISFLKKKLDYIYLKILILNISAIVLFLSIRIQNYGILVPKEVGLTFIILSIIMFITIKQSFDLYYKQNLLEKDLKETKEELEAKKKEVEKLEIENLEFSKTSHSLAHKQKALEYRLSQLTKLGKINEDEEIDIKNELENISEEMYKEPEDIELAKTDIPSIDNMFSYMQSECIKDNIKFELQVVGNIHYMVNNLISENELEILIADHIKDAIIAINHSDNSNRSILVRIGRIDNLYSLYIYDSGIEFTKEVLDNLGKKPITTHADTGGTGMGFMNTFDTLNKTKASLIINEIGNPCEDNYTKVLIFKFDNQNEFKVNSYKNEVVV